MEKESAEVKQEEEGETKDRRKREVDNKNENGEDKTDIKPVSSFRFIRTKPLDPPILQRFP